MIDVGVVGQGTRAEAAEGAALVDPPPCPRDVTARRGAPARAPVSCTILSTIVWCLLHFRTHTTHTLSIAAPCRPSRGGHPEGAAAARSVAKIGISGPLADGTTFPAELPDGNLIFGLLSRSRVHPAHKNVAQIATISDFDEQIGC